MNRTVDIPEELAQFFLNLQPCTRMVDVHANMEKLCQILVEQRQGEPVAWIEVADLKEIAKGARWSGTVWGRPADDKGLYKLPPRVPVYTHADTGEVERLRAVVSRCRNRVSKVIIAKLKLRLERDALRAQLAERDALLRDVHGAMREYEQGCDQFPPFHHNRLMERIDAALLSASADPSAPKCDGNHGGPRCADPECWNDSP